MSNPDFQTQLDALYGLADRFSRHGGIHWFDNVYAEARNEFSDWFDLTFCFALEWMHGFFVKDMDYDFALKVIGYPLVTKPDHPYRLACAAYCRAVNGSRSRRRRE